MCLFATCLDKEESRKELRMDVYDYSLWNLLAKYVAPIGVAVVFLAGFLLTLSSKHQVLGSNV